MITPTLTMMEDFYAVGYAFPGPVGQFDAMEYGAFWQGQDFSSVSKEDYAKLAECNCGEVGTWVRFSNRGEQNFSSFDILFCLSKLILDCIHSHSLLSYY